MIIRLGIRTTRGDPTCPALARFGDFGDVGAAERRKAGEHVSPDASPSVKSHHQHHGPGWRHRFDRLG